MGYQGGNKHTILYFLDYGGEFGGAANTLLQQAALMKRAEHRVVIFFSDYFGKKMSGEYKKICSHMGLKYEWATYQISNQTEDIDVVCIDKNYEILRDKIKSYNPDILHSVQINVCVELIGRELDIPHIMNVYPLIPEFFSLNYMDIFPHYHICDSWFYTKKWMEFLQTDSTCIRTVVDCRRNRKWRVVDGFIHYICVGAVYREKNQLIVIKAFHKALRRGMQGKLTICGYLQGSYAKECVQYIKRNHLEESVILKGFCPDMNEEYRQNDVLICGSTRESYPNAISEAMANGLVIISTPVGGIPEVVKDGENGYLARDYSEDALLEKLIQMRDDIATGKIEKIMENARRTFEEHHSPHAVEGKLTQYYQYVIEDKQKRKLEGDQNKIDIGYVRNAFRPLLRVFDGSKDRFTDVKNISEKLWYLYHVKDRINHLAAGGKELYIWGTGKCGVSAKEMMEIFLPQIKIQGFLDTNRQGTFEGYDIYYPDEILQKENTIIVVAAMNGQNEMIGKLQHSGRVFNEDYFLLAKRCW